MLHVIGDDALLGNIQPHVLVSVEIDDGGIVADTQFDKHLVHVAFEAFRLWMVDTHAGGCLYPEIAVERLLNVDDVAVGQGGTVLGVALEVLEGISVITVESRRSAKPHISPRVLDDTVHLAAGQTVFGIYRLEQIDSQCGQRQQYEYQKQYFYSLTHDCLLW